MEWMYSLLFPIQWVVAWIMYGWHWLLELVGISGESGLSWVLAIVGLTLTIRTALIPLFFKQIHASRGMQVVAPEMKKLQAKYANKKDQASREAMAREMQELYKKHQTSPFASCMPLLLQMPIFFALFRVLNTLPQIASGVNDPIGPINKVVAGQIESSTFFGAPLSETFLNTDVTQVKIVTAILILIMSVTQFFTQRQLTMKNMPPSALEGPTAAMQKNMMYIFPVIFAVSGVNFPIGVLVYWTISNVWSMGQQFYTIRKIPTPGSEAARRLEERSRAKGIGEVTSADGTTTTIAPPTGQRQQPMSAQRQKRKKKK